MKTRKKWVRHGILAGVGVFLLCFTNAQMSFAASSCVSCHTDEDMIVDNLAKVEAKSSALTSGSG